MKLGKLRPQVPSLSTAIAGIAPAGPERYGQGRGGRPWRRKRARILARDKYCCQTCRRAARLTVATQVDHIVPLAAGGSDEDDNLEGICDPCHAVKGAQDAKRYGW